MKLEIICGIRIDFRGSSEKRPITKLIFGRGAKPGKKTLRKVNSHGCYISNAEKGPSNL